MCGRNCIFLKCPKPVKVGGITAGLPYNKAELELGISLE